jgi:hypothetical protein
MSISEVSMSDVSLQPKLPPSDSTAAKPMAAGIASGALGVARVVGAKIGAEAGAAVGAIQEAKTDTPTDTVNTAKRGGAAASIPSLAEPASEHGQILKGCVQRLTEAKNRETGAVATIAHAIGEIKGPLHGLRIKIAEHADKVHAHAVAKSDTIRAKAAKLANALPGEPVKTPELVKAAFNKAVDTADKAADTASDAIDQAIRDTAEALRKGPTPPHEIPAKLREAVEDTIKNMKPPLPLHEELHKSLDRVIKELKPQRPENQLGDFPLPDKRFVKI